MRRRLRAHRPQCVGLRLATSLGEGLGDVGEDDGQPQPERDREREPRGLVAAAERAAAEDLDEPGDRRDDRADLDDEHDRVADLHARVELDQRGHDRGAHDLGVEQRLGLLGGHAVGASRAIARLSSSTLTPGSPNTPRNRPSVC